MNCGIVTSYIILFYIYKSRKNVVVFYFVCEKIIFAKMNILLIIAFN